MNQYRLIIALSGGKNIHLSILRTREIVPHEKTIPSLLRAVQSDMKRTGYQRDPILVDSKTNVALDGMHRLKSLRLLGAKFALCAEYNYLDRSIKLERWLRTMIAPSQKIVSAVVSKFGMSPCSSLRAAVSLVDERNKGIALLSAKESFFGGENLNIREICTKISEIDELCEKNGVEFQFRTESEKYDSFSSESVVMLYHAKLSKNDVLRFAETHELLPYKMTRHIVPVRPLGVHFPIRDLRESSFSYCERKLEQIVNFSKVVAERRNVWYEGRKYSERIAVFHSLNK